MTDEMFGEPLNEMELLAIRSDIIKERSIDAENVRRLMATIEWLQWQVLDDSYNESYERPA